MFFFFLNLFVAGGVIKRYGYEEKRNFATLKLFMYRLQHTKCTRGDYIVSFSAYLRVPR